MSPDQSSPSSSNPWFAISMGLIGIIVGYAIGSGVLPAGPAPTTIAQQQPTVPTPPTQPEAPAAQDVKPVDKDRDHIRGNVNAAITVIEYSDFECPFCARHHPTMQQVMEAYGDDVNWVYRHFPLSFHPNAQKAAEASECAGELGGNDAFWKMADIMFEKGSDNTQLTNYAKEIGLDEADFKTCLDSGKYAQYIQDDMAGGSAAGVNGTPGNIVLHNESGDSRIISGAQPFTSFKTIIDEMLKN